MATLLHAPSTLALATPSVPQHVDVIDLVANVSQDYTVPASVTFALFSADGGFYIAYGSAVAAVPAATDVTGANSLYIPSSAQFSVESGTVLSLIASANTIVTIGCYIR